jgi:uncharacterized repeat protein (TIGR03803 family)
MRSKDFSLGFTLAAIVLFILGAATHSTAQTFTILYSFAESGSGPNGRIVFDTAGNMYGTTSEGGTYNGGTVFELSPQAGGGWSETILHSFNNVNLVDGCEPYAGLAMDSAGNLYGTTRACGSQGLGTVFELTPAGGGNWTETVLHSFGSTSTTDGAFPYATLVLDSVGNLYGTTLEGGTGRSGTVFELAHGATRWNEKVLYNFVPDAEGDGGFNPRAGVVLDSAGNLYGTTEACTCSYTNQGTVFELRRTGGVFAEKVLHYFYDGGADGYDPVASLVLDSKGDLYGTTSEGGTFGGGTVFELSRTPSGKWKETTLHNFNGTAGDGFSPAANVTFGAHGELYGTTVFGGAYTWGTVFELSPSGQGTWNETILHNFNYNVGDGDDLSSPVTLDTLGNLYGTAPGSGAYDGGDVFEITP